MAEYLIQGETLTKLSNVVKNKIGLSSNTKLYPYQIIEQASILSKPFGFEMIQGFVSNIELCTISGTLVSNQDGDYVSGGSTGYIYSFPSTVSINLNTTIPAGTYYFKIPSGVYISYTVESADGGSSSSDGISASFITNSEGYCEFVIEEGATSVSLPISQQSYIVGAGETVSIEYDISYDSAADTIYANTITFPDKTTPKAYIFDENEFKYTKLPYVGYDIKSEVYMRNDAVLYFDDKSVIDGVFQYNDGFYFETPVVPQISKPIILRGNCYISSGWLDDVQVTIYMDFDKVVLTPDIFTADLTQAINISLPTTVYGAISHNLTATLETTLNDLLEQPELKIKISGNIQYVDSNCEEHDITYTNQEAFLYCCQDSNLNDLVMQSAADFTGYYAILS